MLNILNSIDNFFCEIEGKTKPKTLNGVSQTLNRLNEVNEQFNRELELLASKKIASNHVFKLGYPNSMYLKAGVENLPIELSARTIQNKASKNYKRPHPFEPSSLKNLPLALHEPIAIFKGSQNRVVVLLELEDNGNNFTAILGIYQPPKGRRKGEKVNSIISIFPKDDANEVAKMLKLPVLWEDKTKMSRFNQVHNSCYAEGLNTAHKGTNVKQKNTNAKTLPEVNAAFNAKLKEFEANGYKFSRMNDYFSCGLPNDVLIECGFNASKQIIITQAVMRKALGLAKGKNDEAHNIKVSGLNDLPIKLNNPIVVIKGSLPNSRLVFVDLGEEKGRKSLVALHFNWQLKRHTVVTNVASIYSKPNLAVVNLINESYYKNEVYYTNSDLIKNWLTKSQGLQLPLVGLTSNKNLSKEDWLSVTGQLQLLPRIKANLSGTNIKQKKIKSNKPAKKQPKAKSSANLKLPDIDKILEELISNAEPFRKVELTDDSYGKEFEKGFLSTPIGTVKIDKTQIHKLIRKARVNFFGLVKPTLEKPLIIVTSKDLNGIEREAFIKTFSEGKTIFFVSFIKTDKDLMVVSNHSRREGQIKKILSEGNITYSQNSITALSGSPNITEPTYKTLLIGLRLESLSKDKQKTSQNQQVSEKPTIKPKTLAKKTGAQETKETPLLIARKEAMKVLGSKGIQELRRKWKIDWDNEKSIRDAIQSITEAETEAKRVLETLSGVQTQVLNVNNAYPNGVNTKDLKNKYNSFKSNVVFNHDKGIDIVFKSIGLKKSINGRKDAKGKVIPIDSIIATAISQLPYLLEYATFQSFGKANKPAHKKVKGVKFWNFSSKLKVDGATHRFIIPVLETENANKFQYSIEYADIKKILVNKKSAVGLKAKINQG